MKLLDRLFRPAPALPPRLALWHAIVSEARDKRWYRDLAVADTVEGRFDMITLVLAVVQLRIEREGDGASSVALTEAVTRNVTLIEGADAVPLAEELQRLHAQIGHVPTEALLAGSLSA